MRAAWNARARAMPTSHLTTTAPMPPPPLSAYLFSQRVPSRRHLWRAHDAARADRDLSGERARGARAAFTADPLALQRRGERAAGPRPRRRRGQRAGRPATPTQRAQEQAQKKTLLYRPAKWRLGFVGTLLSTTAPTQHPTPNTETCAFYELRCFSELGVLGDNSTVQTQNGAKSNVLFKGQILPRQSRMPLTQIHHLFF